MHIDFEAGVVYCDVQTFQQEAYTLKVLGEGSPMTVFWQFDVMQHRDYWLDARVASVRLGRQVLADLVTKRWIMRDLNSGVVRYTTNIQEAMRFLTEMNHAAVVDVSVLEEGLAYKLETRFYLHEGNWEEASGWTSWMDWGVPMGAVMFDVASMMYDEGNDAR